jgi:AraC-like DNA-binding protein
MLKTSLPVHAIDKQSTILIEEIKRSDAAIYNNVPHTHSFFEIGYILGGQGSHTIDFTAYPISNNTVYFLKKGIVHTLYRQAGTHGLVVLFDGYNAIPEQLMQTLSNAAPQLSMPDVAFSHLINLIDQLRWHVEVSNGAPALASKYLELILAIYASYAAKNTEISERLSVFYNYIEANYSAKLSVDKCLEAMKVSYQQLHAEVHDKLNITPHVLITERVLLQAKRLLYNTDLTSKQIGYELGFEDTSYFTKFFKQHTQLTPLQFRVQERLKTN